MVTDAILTYSNAKGDDETTLKLDKYKSLNYECLSRLNSGYKDDTLMREKNKHAYI